MNMTSHHKHQNTYSRLITDLEQYDDITLTGIYPFIEQYIETPQKKDQKIFYELLAFGFRPNPEHDSTGLYYGPHSITHHGDGTIDESPNMQDVTTAVIGYWKRRACETKNPILKVRYCDLVVDFSKHLGIKDYVGYSSLLLQTIIELFAGGFYEQEGKWGIQTLKRGLDIGLKYKDFGENTQLLHHLIGVTLGFEDTIAIDNKPGTWGFSYDLLLDNTRIALDDEYIQIIIDNLESRLMRIIDDKHGYRAAKPAVDRLCEYYIGKDNTKCKTLIGCLLQALESDRYASAEPRIQLKHYQYIYDYYQLYESKGLSVKKEKHNIIEKMQNTSKSIELGRLRITQEFTKQQIDAYIDSFFDEPDGVLDKISTRFIPLYADAEAQTLQHVKDMPEYYFMGTNTLDENHMIAHSVGGNSDNIDIQSHTILLLTIEIGLQNWFLGQVLDVYVDTVSPDILGQKFIDAFMCDNIPQEIIQGLVHNYYTKNYIEFSHICIPFIESILRNIVRELGGNIYKKSSQHQGFEKMVLPELINSPVLNRIGGQYGDSNHLSLYLKVLLVDIRGLNLRNNLCHGFTPGNFMKREHTDRLMHVLLVFLYIQTGKTL